MPFKSMPISISGQGHPNATWLPDPASLHFLPWAGGDSRRVAQAFGVFHMPVDGVLQPMPGDTRALAQKQLKRLDDHDWSLKAGAEMEFRLLGADDLPHVDALDYAGQLSFAGLEDVLFYLCENLLEAGVHTETMHTEYAPGQFEFTLRPELGIKAADDIFLFKNSVKELAAKKGMKATFFGKAHPDEAGGGAHFNFSLWNKNTQTNVFYDEAQPDNLSKIARHWIAGLVHHADALTALCELTVNCYRRLHCPWAPSIANWGIDDRMSSFRMKNAGEQGTYMENRLPSSMANPYLVMAATIAAGLDGVEKELECPAPMLADAPKLPTSIQQALKALDADAAMKAALGEEFITGFLGMKNEVELPKFQNHDASVNDEAHMLAEKLMYERLL